MNRRQFLQSLSAALCGAVLGARMALGPLASESSSEALSARGGAPVDPWATGWYKVEVTPLGPVLVEEGWITGQELDDYVAKYYLDDWCDGLDMNGIRIDKPRPDGPWPPF